MKKLTKYQVAIQSQITIPPETFAIRPVRIIGNQLRTYTGICHPDNVVSIKWARHKINRISIYGIGPKFSGDNCSIDLLDKSGDILETIDISKSAFDYARRQWKFIRAE